MRSLNIFVFLLVLLVSSCITHVTYVFDQKADEGKVFQSKYKTSLGSQEFAKIDQCKKIKKIMIADEPSDKVINAFSFGFVYRTTATVTCAK